MSPSLQSGLLDQMERGRVMPRKLPGSGLKKPAAPML